MTKVEINGKKYEIPQSFDEMTLEQYCKAFYKLPQLDEKMDEVEQFKTIRMNEARILARLMGEDDDFCIDLPLNVYANLNESIKYIYESDYFLKHAKAGVTILGHRYNIPPMSEMSLRQFIDADVVMNNNESDMQYIELLSILLTEKDDKGKWIPYNGDYQDMVGKVRNLKCSDALGLVYHFFKKGEALRKLSQVSMKVVENQQPHNTQSS